MPKGLLSPCLKRSNSTGADTSAGQIGMPLQSVARWARRHGLGAGGAGSADSRLSRESAAFVQVTRRGAQADEGTGPNTSGANKTRSEGLGVVCLTMPFLI
jgi:hypothetical protein